MRATIRLFCLLLALGICGNAGAWDSTGHRLSAAVALDFLGEDTTARLLDLLSAHPRYQQDFLNAMPDFVERGDPAQRTQWLLGQAAYWPDIARGLSQAERERYNRPAWHYIDGAWIRGAATVQGNIYVDREAFADIRGTAAARIESEDQADNVVTALDYNSGLLRDASNPAAQRAVALCWVLHLVGDIHQPLHTGSLFSATVFESGDRGGNGIGVGTSNLHALWDRALRERGVATELADIIALLDRDAADSLSLDWTAWMSESRQALRSAVYDQAMLTAIRRAETGNRTMEAIRLSAAYRERMQQIARQRLGLAGLRLAAWLESELR